MSTIPADALGIIRERVAKLNRKAERLNVEGVTLDVSEPYERRLVDDVTGVTTIERFVDVEVVGPVVQVEGWTFLASIDHAEGGLVRTSPQHEVEGLAAYAETPACEHCGYDRQRSRTYVLGRTDDLDERIQVGSTCLQDFLGHTVSLYIFDAAADLADDLDGWEPTGGPAGWSLESFLAITLAVIETYGWVSRSKAREEEKQATADDVLAFLTSTVPDQILPDGVSPHHSEEASEIIEWAETIEPTNDYLHNLTVVVERGLVTPKSAGIAASLVPAYRKAMEKQAVQESSEPVPETDERIQVTGTVVKVDVKETPYGARYVMTVQDDRGFRLWGTEPKALAGSSVGTRVTFLAGVDRSDDPTFGFFRRPTKAAVVEA